MKLLLYKLSVVVCCFAFCATLSAQNKPDTTPTPKPKKSEKVNFRYSQNPPAKVKPKPRSRIVEEKVKAKVEAKTEVASKQTESSVSNDGATPVAKKTPTEVRESVAQKTRKIAEEESLKNLKPTEIYRVGSGDVLYISLQESRSSYYTVLKDGSIDYPLAGGLVSVVGLTVEGIEDALRDKIQLYENPDVSVTVREHASHKIDVLGMVARPGKQYLQREAMPLYVVRARAIAESGSDIVVVKRPNAEEVTIRSGTPEYDDTLIYPGDVIEFTTEQAQGNMNGFVYVGGAVKDIGRFGFHEGMTLTQAILAAGGLANDKVKKASVRRKNEKGFLKTKTYKLSDINKGKKVDPVLHAGDTVEVLD